MSDLQKQQDSINIRQNNEELKEKKENQLTKILLYFFLTYIVIILILTILFFSSVEFKTIMVEFLVQAQQKNVNGILLICLIGVICILIGFPIMIYEIALGFIMRDFWLALLMMSLIKIVGFTMAFLIARYCLKERIEKLFRFNTYFQTFSKAVEKNPYKVVTLLKVMMIPAPIKNYGVGILRVSFIQFFIPTVITSPFLAWIWIYVGTEIGTIYQAVDQGEGFEVVNYIRITFMILTILIFFYITWLSMQFYEDVVKEIEDLKKKEESEENQLLIQSQEEQLVDEVTQNKSENINIENKQIKE